MSAPSLPGTPTAPTRGTGSLAILSDIHGNLPALEAVLRDLEHEGAESIVVLGDTIGYGPHPVQCLELARSVASVFLLGNHESETLTWSDDLGAEAAECLRWTTGRLEGVATWDRIVERARLEGISALASQVVEGRHYVHASPLSPTRQYIWPGHECQYLLHHEAIDARIGGFLAEFTTLHGFFGHTHVPAVLTARSNRDLFNPFRGTPMDWNRRHTFVGVQHLYVIPEGDMVLEPVGDRTLAINPGSVGLSRYCGDTRASYALYDGDRLLFRRVPYDLGTTLKDLEELPISASTRQYLGHRLRTGM